MAHETVIDQVISTDIRRLKRDFNLKKENEEEKIDIQLDLVTNHVNETVGATITARNEGVIIAVDFIVTDESMVAYPRWLNDLDVAITKGNRVRITVLIRNQKPVNHIRGVLDVHCKENGLRLPNIIEFDGEGVFESGPIYH